MLDILTLGAFLGIVGVWVSVDDDTWCSFCRACELPPYDESRRFVTTLNYI